MPADKFLVSLLVRNLALSHVRLIEIRCLQCGLGLDWHQPNPRTPDQILGVCLECGRWHLLDRTANHENAVLALLPGPHDIRGSN